MKAGSECWGAAPAEVHRSCGMTWPQRIVQDGTNNLCQQQDQKCTAAVQLHLCLFTTIRATGSCQVPELNGTAGEGLRVTHREEFITPETSRRTDKKPWKKPGLSNQPFPAPEMAGSKSSSSIEDGIAQNAGQNALVRTDLQPLYRGCTNANQWTARAPLSCSPLTDSWGPGPGIPTSASLPHRENKLL